MYSPPCVVVHPSLERMTTTPSNHWMLWVRRSLMSPILALKVWLQNGQANAGAEFVRDAVPSLLLWCWRFCCCSGMRLVSYPDTQIWARCARQSSLVQDLPRSRGWCCSISRTPSSSLCSTFFVPLGNACPPSALHKRDVLVDVHQTCDRHDLPIWAGNTWAWRRRSPSMLSRVPLCQDFCPAIWCAWCSFPVAQLVEHGASNAKIMGSIPRESKSWSNVETVTWMQCKSLWIKASAKCINVNVNVSEAAHVKIFELFGRLYTVQVSQAYCREGRMTARYTLSLVSTMIPLLSHTLS